MRFIQLCDRDYPWNVGPLLLPALGQETHRVALDSPVLEAVFPLAPKITEA